MSQNLIQTFQQTHHLGLLVMLQNVHTTKLPGFLLSLAKMNVIPGDIQYPITILVNRCSLIANKKVMVIVMVVLSGEQWLLQPDYFNLQTGK